MIYETIGWIGTGLVLLAYLMVSTRKMNATSREYQLMNLFGSIGILINSAVHGAIPSVGLNVVWLLIAVYGLLSAKK